jgi:hypothetical protein
LRIKCTKISIISQVKISACALSFYSGWGGWVRRGMTKAGDKPPHYVGARHPERNEGSQRFFPGGTTSWRFAQNDRWERATRRVAPTGKK